VDVLINLSGQPVRAGMRDVAVAVSKIGLVHIRMIGGTLIVTFEPESASEMSLAGAFYKIADLRPERTIVVAGIANSVCWSYPGYTSALKKMDELACETGNREVRVSNGMAGYPV